MPHMYNHTDNNRETMKPTTKGMKKKETKAKPKNPIKKPKPNYEKTSTKNVSY
tara:strand:- start:184 stop:342 length:159 start_codon:yes stop_codon:yes gene_type:complete